MADPVYSKYGQAIIPQGTPQVPVNPTAEQLAARTRDAGIAPPTNTQNNAYDANGNRVQIGDLSLNPQFSTTDPTIKRTIDPAPGSTAPATGAAANDPEAFLNTWTPPKTAEQIAEEKRKSSQAVIDSIQAGYDRQIQTARKAGDDRLNVDRATSVLSGLMGSTDAGRTHNKVVDANTDEENAINEKRALDVANVYAKIEDDARTEAEQQLTDATKSAEDIVARRKATQEQALSNLKTMAAAGIVDYDQFSTNPKNKEVYDYALKAVGGSDEALRSVFILNRPQDQIVGTPQRVGSKYVQAYKNPVTGKISFESIDLPEGLGDNYSTFQKLGDNLVAIPDGWDGDTSKLKTIVGQPSTEDALRIQGLRLDNEKKERDLNGGDSDYNGDFQATIQKVANMETTVAGKGQVATDMKGYIAAGDYKSAYDQISNSVENSLVGEPKARFANARSDAQVMQGLRSAVQAFADAGGDTGLLKGKADDIGKKLGKLATDPKFSSLATELNREFQTYRNTMTGAAFGPEESREYASVNPSAGNSLDLNLATLDGAIKQLNNRVDSTVESRAGEGARYIKEKAEGGGSAGAPAASSLSEQVRAAGYDYDQMHADGNTDDEIKKALGLE